MPRRKLLRRFEPRYGVGTGAIEEEAKYLRCEIEDYTVLSAADVNGHREKRYMSCKHSWQVLQLLLDRLAEREQAVVQCLLFRDIYHILELYVAHLRSAHPDSSANPPPQVESTVVSNEFSEWLFDP